MNIFIDIETIPQQPEMEIKAIIAKTIKAPGSMSKPETIEQWHKGEGKYAGIKEKAIENQYRKTSFDGAKGEIISIAWAVEDREVKNLYRGLDDDISSYEGLMLSAFFNSLNVDLDKRKPFFIGHYISEFDLKFLFQRSVINSIDPGIDLMQWAKHGTMLYDTMSAWAGYGNKISQDNLCKALGIEGKPDDIDGSKVWDFVKSGDVKKVSAYNKDDVEKIREIYKRMKFITMENNII